MKKVSLDTWIQLLGMVGLLGGLVFVGAELRQTQRIALAEQQQSRTEVFIDMLNTMSETDVSFHRFQRDGLYRGSEVTVENFLHQLWWIHENDYLQYSLNLMDNGVWQSKLRAIESLYNGNGEENVCPLAKQVWSIRRNIINPELVSLVEAMPSKC
ncbi:MAG TPA: hypothetical protein DIT65_06385 [Cryomorphaceae bacterium]|nr:hypothetical protein [Cryomorphaceae bacterium]|tara:strand:- start:90 stop:557 length:468 start_codon:yes stop_codon:yes gene_type:complete